VSESAAERVGYSPGRIAANMGWLSGGSALSMLLSAAYGVALARLMGPVLFGDYVYVISLQAIAAPLAVFGLYPILVREMSNRPQERASLVGSALLLFFLFSFVTMLVLLVAAWFFVREQHFYMSLCILSLSLVGGAVTNGAGPAFVASEKMQYRALLDILRSIFLPLFVLPVLVLVRRLDAIMGAIVIASFVGSGIAYLLLLRVIGRPIMKWDWKLWMFLLGQSSPIFATAMLMAGFDRVDVLVLRSARGAAVCGQYRAVYQILAIMKKFTGSLGTALLPTIFSSAKQDPLRHARIYRFISRLTWAGFLWLALCISLTAQPLTQLMYGKEFVAAAPAVALLAWCIPFIAVTFMLSNFFTAVRKQHYLIHVWAITLGTNIAANLVLTYRFGIMGAAASMLMSSVALCASQQWLAHSHLGLRAEWTKLLALAVSCGTAFGISRAFLPESPVLCILAATVIYLASAFAMGGLGRREMVLLREVVTRR